MIHVGSARIDENGKLIGGQAGDQTGQEVAVEAWYRHDKGWVVIRAKDAAVRERIAQCMEAACANNSIGYDQSTSWDLYDGIAARLTPQWRQTVAALYVYVWHMLCSATFRGFLLPTKLRFWMLQMSLKSSVSQNVQSPQHIRCVEISCVQLYRDIL